MPSKQRAALPPVAEQNEPYPNDHHNAFKQPVLPAVPSRAPTSIAQGAVRPAAANIAEVTEEP